MELKPNGKYIPSRRQGVWSDPYSSPPSEYLVEGALGLVALGVQPEQSSKPGQPGEGIGSERVAENVEVSSSVGQSWSGETDTVSGDDVRDVALDMELSNAENESRNAIVESVAQCIEVSTIPKSVANLSSPKTQTHPTQRKPVFRENIDTENAIKEYQEMCEQRAKAEFNKRMQGIALRSAKKHGVAKGALFCARDGFKRCGKVYEFGKQLDFQFDRDIDVYVEHMALWFDKLKVPEDYDRLRDMAIKWYDRKRHRLVLVRLLSFFRIPAACMFNAVLNKTMTKESYEKFINETRAESFDFDVETLSMLQSFGWYAFLTVFMGLVMKYGGRYMFDEVITPRLSAMVKDDLLPAAEAVLARQVAALQPTNMATDFISKVPEAFEHVWKWLKDLALKIVNALKPTTILHSIVYSVVLIMLVPLALEYARSTLVQFYKEIKEYLSERLNLGEAFNCLGYDRPRAEGKGTVNILAAIISYIGLGVTGQHGFTDFFSSLPKVTSVAKSFEWLFDNFTDVFNALMEMITGEIRGHNAYERDIVEFISEVDQVEIKLQVGDIDVLHGVDVREAIQKLRNSRTRIQGNLRMSRPIRPVISNLYTRAETKVNILFAKYERMLKSANPRAVPVWIYIHGSPGVGKSHALHYLRAGIWEYVKQYSNIIEDSDEYSPAHVYAGNETEEFFDGYCGQFFTIYDDLFQTKDTDVRTRTAQTLIHMVSPEPYSLRVADLEQKSTVYFRSRCILTTTNLPGSFKSQNLGLTDIEALESRRSLVLELKDDGFHLTQGFNQSIIVDDKQVLVLSKEDVARIAGEMIIEQEKNKHVNPKVQPLERFEGKIIGGRITVGYSEEESEKIRRSRVKNTTTPTILANRKMRANAPAFVPAHQPKKGKEAQSGTEEDMSGLTLEERINKRVREGIKEKGFDPDKYCPEPKNPEFYDYTPKDTYEKSKRRLARKLAGSYMDGDYYPLGRDADKVVREVEEGEPDDYIPPRTFVFLPSRKSWNLNKWIKDNIEEYVILELPQFTKKFYNGLKENLSNKNQYVKRVFSEWKEKDIFKDPVDNSKKVMKKLLKSSAEALLRGVKFARKHWKILAGFAISVIAVKVMLKLLGTLMPRTAYECHSGEYDKHIWKGKKNKGKKASKHKGGVRDKTYYAQGLEETISFGRNARSLTVRRCTGNFEEDMEGKIIGFSWCLFVYKNVALIPRHTIYANKDDDEDVWLTFGPEVRFHRKLSKCEVIDEVESDLVLVRVPGMPSFRDITNRFFDDIPDSGKMELIVFDRKSTHGLIQRAIDWDNDIRTIYVNEKYGDFETDLIFHGVQTMQGFCGSPYVCSKTGKIIGIHQGGTTTGGTGFAVHVSGRTLREYRDKESQCLEPLTLDYMPTTRVEGLYDIGTLSPERAVFLPTKSQIKESRLGFKDFPLGETTNKPAHLRPFEKDGQMIYPVTVALAKYGIQESIGWEPPDVTLEDFLPQTFNASKIRLWTEEEAIEGIPGYADAIDMTTSTGYFFKKQGYSTRRGIFGRKDGKLTKHPFYELQFERYMNALKEGNYYPVVFEMTLKDELRSQEKVDKGETRLFDSGDLVSLIIQRIYLGSFLTEATSDPVNSPIGLGLNAHSKDWGMLYSRLKGDPKDERFPIAGDFSGFDMSIENMLYDKFIQLVKMYHPEPDVAERVILANRDGWHILRNRVFLRPWGTSSGSYITSLFNSFCNWYLHKVAFVCLYGHESWKDVECTFTGDDSLLSVPKKYNEYNAVYLNKFFWDKFRMRYTSSDKTAVRDITWEEVTYLKRRFVLGHFGIMAPLDANSICNIAKWAKSDEDKSNLISRINNLLQECFHYDENTYKKVYNWCQREFRYNKCFPKNYNIPIPRWETMLDMRRKAYAQ